MAKLIFQEVWWEPKSISICYMTMFSVLLNQVNVTDIVNKSSVSFFIVTKVAKNNSGVFAVQDRIIMWHAKKSTDQLQYLNKFYLTYITI